MNVDVEQVITDQSEKSLDKEDIKDKLNSVEQTITIKEVGTYLHPAFLMNDSKTRRYRKHRRQGGKPEDFEELGPFEFEEKEYLSSLQKVSLLGFVLDENTDYTIDEFDQWIKNDQLPEDSLEAYKEWIVDEDSYAFQQFYSETDVDKKWALKDRPKYNKGVITPVPAITILFEDSTGTLYIGAQPIDKNEQEVKQLLDTVLAESTEEETEYTTKNTDVTISGNTLLFDDFELYVGGLFPIDWFTVPLLEYSFEPIKKSEYEVISSYKNGWYEVPATIHTDNAVAHHYITLSLPWDKASLNWSPSLGEKDITRVLFEEQEDSDEIEDTITVKITPLISASNKNISYPFSISDSSMWVIQPPVDKTTKSLSEETIEQEIEETGNSTGLIEQIRNLL